MGFEDSMIEDGYHDEGDYLEHLMDDAEKSWKRQQAMESTWNSYDEGESFPGEDYDEYYENIIDNQYKPWIENNPIKFELFIAWLDVFTRMDYDDNYFFVKKFLEWEQDEATHIEQLKNFYEDFFPRIYSFFEWKTENYIENYLRQPVVYYFDKDVFPGMRLLQKSEVLQNEVEDFELWIKKKKEYESWLENASSLAKECYDYDICDLFDGDVTSNHVYEILQKQIEKEDESVKQLVLEWFWEDREKGKDLYVYIQRVKYYDTFREKSLSNLNSIKRKQSIEYRRWVESGVIDP